MATRLWRLPRRKSRPGGRGSGRGEGVGARPHFCALLALLRAGDEVIATRQLYGGSYKLLRDILPGFGIAVRHVESDLAGIERLVSPRTKVLYIETPTNPTLRLVDLEKAVAFAQGMGLDLHGRQHVRQPGAAEAAGDGIQHGGAQRHQISWQGIRT